MGEEAERAVEQRVHIVLVGGQPMPVYLGHRALGASHFVPLVSDVSRPVGLRLNAVLSGEGVVCLAPALIDPYNLEDVSSAVQRVAGQFSNRAEIWVNVTGGTKIMALAAFTAAAEVGANVVYVSTETRSVITFRDRDIRTRPLRVPVTLEQYFRLHGFAIIESAQYDGVARQLARELGRRCSSLARLVDFFHTARAKGWVEIPFALSAEEEQALRRIAGAGWIDLQRRSGQWYLRWRDREGREFLQGAWLECYVADELSRDGFWDEVATGVKVLAEDVATVGKQGVENEFDVLAIRDGQLAVLSCKSGIRALKSGREAKPILYEITSLTRREGLGTYCRRFIVSPTRTVSDAVRQRAGRSGVDLVLLEDLPNVARVVREVFLQRVAKP